MSHQLEGCRVLVVEDSPLIAAELDEELQSFGALVVGPATSLAKALELAVWEPFDAPILDLSLGDAMSFPAAELLIERNAPFQLQPATTTEWFLGATSGHLGFPSRRSLAMSLQRWRN